MADKPDVDGLLIALEEVFAGWTNFIQAKTPLLQAGYLNSVNDKLQDLYSYHPKYNYRTGEIDGVFDDGDY